MGRGFEELLAAQPETMSHDECLDLLDEIQRAQCALDAVTVRALAALDREDSGPDQWVREEVATALRVAPSTAGGHLRNATRLVKTLPDTLRAVSEGVLSLRHARVLLDAVDGLDADVVSLVEARVLARCGGTTVGEFRQQCRRAAAALDPSSVRQRHNNAYEQRRVEASFTTSTTGADDGMAYLSGYIRADHAAAAFQRLTAVAGESGSAPGAADTRTVDQRRADAFVDLLLGEPDGRCTGGPTIIATLTTLTGAADLPAELANGVTIAADIARQIAADPNAFWRPVLLDHDGVLIAHGARTYRPGAQLREKIILRDRTCRFPGCRRTARNTDLDHITPFPAGPTTETNLHSLCRRHHRLKHHAGWTVRRTATGTTHWITPTGRTIDKPPESYPVDPAPATQTDHDPPPF